MMNNNLNNKMLKDLTTTVDNMGNYLDSVKKALISNGQHKEAEFLAKVMKDAVDGKLGMNDLDKLTKELKDIAGTNRHNR